MALNLIRQTSENCQPFSGNVRTADTGLLESVTRFLFDNIGNVVSTKKISDTLTSLGRKIDVKTVEKYVSALTESFVLYEARRYDIQGKDRKARKVLPR